MSGQGEITRLLNDWRDGDPGAFDQLLPLAYPRLRRIAAGCMHSERDPRIQATELVHELFLRLIDQHKAEWKDSGHFYSFAARLMRMILIDQARQAKAGKRGGMSQRVPLSDDLTWISLDPTELLALDGALEELDKIDSRKVQLIELRYLLGCSAEEAAEALGISKATADRELRTAKAWLYSKLGPDSGQPAQTSSF